MPSSQPLARHSLPAIVRRSGGSSPHPQSQRLASPLPSEPLPGRRPACSQPHVHARGSSPGAVVVAAADSVSKPSTPPLDVSTEPLDVSTEPLDVSTEPLDVSTEPLDVSIGPQPATTVGRTSALQPTRPRSRPSAFAVATNASTHQLRLSMDQGSSCDATAEALAVVPSTSGQREEATMARDVGGSGELLFHRKNSDDRSKRRLNDSLVPAVRISGTSNGRRSLPTFLGDRRSKRAATFSPSDELQRNGNHDGRRSLPSFLGSTDRATTAEGNLAVPRNSPAVDFEPSVGRPVPAFSPIPRKRSPSSAMLEKRSPAALPTTVFGDASFSSSSPPPTPAKQRRLCATSSSPTTSLHASSSSLSSSSPPANSNNNLATTAAASLFITSNDDSNDTQYSRRRRARQLARERGRSGIATKSVSASPTNSIASSASSSSSSSHQALRPRFDFGQQTTATATASATTATTNQQHSSLRSAFNVARFSSQPSLPDVASAVARPRPTFASQPYNATNGNASERNGRSANVLRSYAGIDDTAAATAHGGFCDDDTRSSFPGYAESLPTPPQPASPCFSDASSGALSVERHIAGHESRNTRDDHRQRNSQPQPTVGSFSPCSDVPTAQPSPQPRSLLDNARLVVGGSGSGGCSPSSVALIVGRRSRALLQDPLARRVDDSTLTEEELSKWRSLPNDRCPDTAANEKAFLEEHGFVPYSAYADAEPSSSDHRSHPVTVVSSRVTRARYSMPVSAAPFHASVFQRHFERTGHTLTIDYTRSYARLFALDVDCSCRRFRRHRRHRHHRRRRSSSSHRDGAADETSSSIASSVAFTGDSSCSDSESVRSSSRCSTSSSAPGATDPPYADGALQHMDESTMHELALHVAKVLREHSARLPDEAASDNNEGTSLRQQREVRYEVWRNGCGFHLYTDVPVSLPSHIQIARFVAARFAQHPCVLEVPDEMPLPFSAKHSGQPYTFAFAGHSRPDILRPVVAPFVELFDSIHTHAISLDAEPVVHVHDSDTASDYDVSFFRRPHTAASAAAAASVVVGRDAPFSYLVPCVSPAAVRVSCPDRRYAQFALYLRHRIRYLNALPRNNAAGSPRSTRDNTSNGGHPVATEDDDEGRADDEAMLGYLMAANRPLATSSPSPSSSPNNHRRLDDGNDSPVSHVTYAPGYDDEVDVDVHALDDRKLRDRVQDFFRAFNRLFFDREDCSTCGGFLELATAASEGALMLQPYVVAMHKCLQPISMTDMRVVLRAVLAARTCDDNTIARFVALYDEHTLNAYTETGEAMLKHLAVLRRHGITPFMDLNQQVDRLMAATLGCQNAAAFKASLQRKMKPEERADLRQKAIEAYAQALCELHVVLHNKTSLVYYVFDGDGYVMHGEVKPKHLPQTIFAWIGSSSRGATDGVVMQVGTTVPQITENELFTMSHFMFATTVGVFNSLTSMYTAKTRFLRYTCYRYASVWPPERPRTMYAEQNHDVLRLLMHHEVYVRTLIEQPGQLFTHFLLAPAILQLDSVGFIEEAWISQLLSILDRFPEWDQALFLMDYYPIDPAYVFVLMHLYRRYGGFRAVTSYRRMVHQVLQYEAGTKETWTKKLGPVYRSATYDADAPTYLDALLSLRGDGLTDRDRDHGDGDAPVITRDFAFLSWLVALLLTKTTHHEPFVFALYRPSRDMTRREHPEYQDFVPRVDSRTSRANKERAARIVFGEEARVRDGKFIDTLFSMGMSTFFDPSNTIELLSVLSYMFVPYNRHKKIFLFHGYGNNGKSFLCNLIQDMTMPKTGRFQHLDTAMERSSVTLKNAVTILNEVERVDSSKIKTVTGNDPESTKIFYSQVYEMCRSQSLIYGATNKIVKFRGETLADVATVNRFHVVKLHGKQIRADRPMSCLLQLLVREELLPNAVQLSEWQMVHYANILVYLTYLLRRDETLYPTINVENEGNVEYRDRVYRTNNRLYDFLRSIDLVEVENFSISAERLLHLVTVNIRDQKRPPYFRTLEGFCTEFAAYYGVQLEPGVVVPNLQELHLVRHITRNTQVEACPGSVITTEDLQRQTLMYLSDAVVDNAVTYLQTRYPNHFDRRKRCFVDLRFRNPPLECDPIAVPFGTDRLKQLRAPTPRDRRERSPTSENHQRHEQTASTTTTNRHEQPANATNRSAATNLRDVAPMPSFTAVDRSVLADRTV